MHRRGCCHERNTPFERHGDKVRRSLNPFWMGNAKRLPVLGVSAPFIGHEHARLERVQREI
jgi:hypothetical protein